MDRYIGLDVHKESCTAVVLSPAGKVLKTEVLETNGEALVQFVERLPRPRHLCMEEGTFSEWLYEVFLPHIDDLLVIIPPHREGPKDDARDARDCAERHRTGSGKRSVFKGVQPVAGLRDAVRAYRQLTRDEGRVKNRIQAVLRSRGLGDAGGDLYDAERRKPWIARLPVNQQFLATTLGAELDKLTELRGLAEVRVREEGKRHLAVKLLQTEPGIGPLRAAEIVATVVTPHRFRTARQFWAYCGLGIVTVASAQWALKDGELVPVDKQLTRGLNRNRCPALKAVFKGAAHTVIHQLGDHPLRQGYVRALEAKIPEHRARLTLARRLAAIALAMWKHQEVYDPAKHRRQPQG